MNGTWDRILKILQKNLNPGLFRMWLLPLHGQVEGTICRLTATNAFMAMGARDRLHQVVQQAANDVLGQPATVIFDHEAERPDAAGHEANQPAAQGTPSHAAHRPLPVAQPCPSAAQPSWRFQFGDFVVGPCNELAYAASQGLCHDTLAADQLFLCSGPGLGKTHLVQAIGQSMAGLSNRSQVRVRYLTAEEFATRMVLALKMREIERFKADFREGVDLLLLEDVHFLQNKERIQDELLSTLKALRDRGARVVFTSSFLPRELAGVDKQLASRFSSGFLARIDRPDLTTRMRILQLKAKTRYLVDVPEDVSALLAEHIHSDIRQLESCLQSLVLKARLLNRALTTDLAWEVLHNYDVSGQVMSMESIISSVCRNFRLETHELCSKSRKAHIVLARNTAFFLARQHTALSLADIGAHFGRRHSTVLKGITKVEREMAAKTPQGRQLERTLELLHKIH